MAMRLPHGASKGHGPRQRTMGLRMAVPTPLKGLPLKRDELLLCSQPALLEQADVFNAASAITAFTSFLSTSITSRFHGFLLFPRDSVARSRLPWPCCVHRNQAASFSEELAY